MTPHILGFVLVALGLVACLGVLAVILVETAGWKLTTAYFGFAIVVIGCLSLGGYLMSL